MFLKRIVVLRHAESQEDIDPNLHNELSDEQISITPNGANQAQDLIARVLSIVSMYKSVGICSSPSNRVVQTASIIKAGLKGVCGDIIIEPRIRNLNWGNITPETVRGVEKERYRVGVLHFQFPEGDHSPTFVSKINQFVQELIQKGKTKDSPELLVIVTHGFALRIIAKALLQMSDADFRWIKNPPNCYIADFSISDSDVVSIREPLPAREPT